MAKFTVFTKKVVIEIGHDERQPRHLVFEAGDRLKINPRDFVHVDGKHIVHTMVIENGKFIHEDIYIPRDAVTENTLKNFGITPDIADKLT